MRVVVALIALLLLAPLLMVLTAPLHTPAPEWDHVRRAILPGHLMETGRLLLLTATAAIVFGTVSAWLVASARFPGHGLFRWALMLPLALPTYIGAITFAGVLGPTGSITVILRSVTGLGIDIMTRDGLALIFGLLLYPYVYLPARAAFSGGLVDVLEASRLLGAGPWRRALQVAIPLARPAIGGGALLVAMETLNDYGAVKYFGVHTLTAGIFRSWGGLYDTGSALRLSAILLLIALLLAMAERRSGRQAARTANGHRYHPTELTGWRAWACTAWCTALLAVAFALPIGALLYNAFQNAGAMAWHELAAPAWNTLKLAGWSAVITLGVALLFSYVQRNGRAALTQAASIGYVVPGAVIAIGVMGLAGRWAHATSWVLIGTLPLLVYAFTVRFLAMATNPMNAGMAQQSRSLDEAARLLGASRLRVFVQVNLPLLRPSILAATAITLIEVIKELPLTLILRPFGMETLSTHVFYLARIEQWGDAAVPALLIVAVGAVPVFLLERLMTHR